MRISLYLPVYAPVAYAGQTPVAYKRAARDKFERGLVERGADIFTHATELLDFQAAQGELHRRPHTVYTFTVEEPAKLGEVINLALDTFNLKTVTVATDQDAVLREVTDGVADDLLAGVPLEDV